MKKFPLEGHEYIELHNLLKVTGLCASGGEAKQQISSGKVLVDGVVELRKRCKLRYGQVVDFSGTSIQIIR